MKRYETRDKAKIESHNKLIDDLEKDIEAAERLGYEFDDIIEKIKSTDNYYIHKINL